MSIIQTIGQSEFQDGLRGEYFSFTYDATEALYNYYEELSDGLSEPIDFDPVAIRCEWSEYDTLAEAYEQYMGDDKDLPEEQRRTTDEQQLEYFEDNTQIIELDNGHVLVSEF